MSEVEVETVMAGWSNADKMFADILIKIVKSRYEVCNNERKERGLYPIPLKDIAIKADQHMVPHVGELQEITKMRDLPGRNYMKVAKDMLWAFHSKGELTSSVGETFKLKENGELYKHLAEVLCI